MRVLAELAYAGGGAVLMNAVPHIVAGVLGRPFQTPFATPPGKGLSSSQINMLWGCANLALGWWLIERLGSFDIRRTDHAVALFSGLLLCGWGMARHFGRLHGGMAPQ